MSTALSRLYMVTIYRGNFARKTCGSRRGLRQFSKTRFNSFVVFRGTPYFAIVRGFGFVSKDIIFHLFKAASFGQ